MEAQQRTGVTSSLGLCTATSSTSSNLRAVGCSAKREQSSFGVSEIQVEKVCFMLVSKNLSSCCDSLLQSVDTLMKEGDDRVVENPPLVTRSSLSSMPLFHSFRCLISLGVRGLCSEGGRGLSGPVTTVALRSVFCRLYFSSSDPPILILPGCKVNVAHARIRQGQW